MKKSGTLETLLDCGIIPIFRTSSFETASAVAEALMRGTIPVLELPLSVPGSLAVIEKVAKRFSNGLLLGAGTVLNPQAVRDAISAGAQFIVSPDTSEKVIDACKQARVPVFPGALTPTEIQRAFAAGADAVKVFPCNAMGGPSYIRSLKAPFPDSLLIPCGGVGVDNAAEYFTAGACALFTGTSLISAALVESGNFSAITKNAKNLAVIVRTSRKNAA
jgi:2-dehydro-3-deoxyphosphogluconate aldolase / (4S)-4-hydroxy-2-oxoglutarate aldolase